MSFETDTALDDLITVRDWLRFAVSRFHDANLAFGHGTSSALDEAAFLILKTLSLPIDTLEPWLDARLTQIERSRVLSVIEKRVTTRRPAPYIVGEAWIGPYRFFVDERVIVPRSYIGEFLCRDVSLLVDEPGAVQRILDLCTGSGCLAILAAMAFPNATVDGVDLSQDALQVAQRNVRDYGLEGDIRLLQSDLFSELKDERYDLIIANPPYVTDEAISKFPPEFSAEPEMAHAGGSDGLSLVRPILEQASGFLNDSGVMIVEVGETEGRLEAAYPDLPFFWLDSENSEGEVFSLRAQDLKRMT